MEVPTETVLAVLWAAYDWVREWQTLVAALLFIGALRLYLGRLERLLRNDPTRASAKAQNTRNNREIREEPPGDLRRQPPTASVPERASERAGRPLRETLQAPPQAEAWRGFPEGGAEFPLPKASPQGASHFLHALSAPPNPAATQTDIPLLHFQPQVPANPNMLARLGELRVAVRSALASIPPDDGNLGGRGYELYAKVIAFSFDDFDDGGDLDAASRPLLQALQDALKSLRADPAENIDARHVWERLADANRLARDLETRVAKHLTGSEVIPAGNAGEGS